MSQTTAQLISGTSAQSPTFGATTVTSLNGGQLAGMRNVIINGGMDLWQRATSQTASGYGSADRWNMVVSGTCTLSQETSVIPTGAQYALKWTTGAAASYGQARQYIEQSSVIPLRGQTVTASAYVRVSANFTGTMLMEAIYNTTSDVSTTGTWTNIVLTTNGVANSSGYTRLTATFTVPSNAVGLAVAVVPSTAQVSGAFAYIGLVQLEPGSAATPFERRSYGQELALCQRYFETSYPAGTAVGAATSAVGIGGISLNAGDLYNSYSPTPFVVPKRASPTINFYAGTTGQAGVLYNNSAASVQGNAGSRFVSQYGCTLYCSNNAMTAANAFSVNFTASAEL